jgi:transposase
LRGWSYEHIQEVSPELRERAVRLVVLYESQHQSQWAAIESFAPKVSCTTETLRRWARQAERDQGRCAGLTSTDRDRLKELERENRELKRANEILRKASAFLPRRSSTADRSDGLFHRRPPCQARG